MSNPAREMLEQRIGGLIFGLSIAVCGLEIVPRWSFFHLGWPTAAFVAIMAVCGAISGFLGATRHRLAGVIGGMVAGPGSLLAIAFVLQRTTWTHEIVVMAAAGIGALPGFAVYRVLAAIETAIMPALDEPRSEFPGPR